MNLLPLNDPEPDDPSAKVPRRFADQSVTVGNLPELLTIRELAKVLKLSPRSIWWLVKNHQLQSLSRCHQTVHSLADSRPKNG